MSSDVQPKSFVLFCVFFSMYFFFLGQEFRIISNIQWVTQV